MHLQQDSAGLNLSLFGATRAALLDHRNADAGREFAHGYGKIDVFIIHDKTEDASADTAPEAVKCLSLRAHVK